MEAKQIEVLRWWHGERDYSTGVMLYGKYGKNAMLKVTFIKPGKEAFMSGKLHYELCKSVGLDWKKMPPLPDDIKKFMGAPPPITKITLIGKLDDYPEISDELLETPYTPEKYVPILSDIKALQYPKVIRRITMEYHENYRDRSMLHKQMKAVPDNNSSENVKKRADLLKQIHGKSDRLEYLYAFMKRYEDSKVVPLEEEVWPEDKSTQLPDDIDKLKRMKINLQTNNTKDNHLLLFQQKTKADKENPMPAGPKRTRIELRIKKREAEILAIDTKIVELENK